MTTNIVASRWIRSFVVCCFSLYAPFCWLLLIARPWSENVILWLKLWPLLPGLFPSWLVFGGHGPNWAIEFTVMGAFAATMLCGLTILGARKSLIAATAIALLISIPTSLGAYSLYRA